VPRPARRLLPRTFQARLTLAFVGVTTLTVALVSLVVINRLDDYFTSQEAASLEIRTLTVRDVVAATVNTFSGDRPVIDNDNMLDPEVATELGSPTYLNDLLADRLAQADVDLVLGTVLPDAAGGWQVDPSPNGTFSGELTAPPQEGQTQEPTSYRNTYRLSTIAGHLYGLQLTLANPYTFRATTLANVTGLLVVTGAIGLALSVVVAAFLALRFATPLRRLSEAARRVGEGELASRVPLEEASAGSAEIGELGRQFNAMAARLEESVEIIRRDRDRSREFVADVSHELSTPIAAMRTFVELLQGPAGADPATRNEFLDSSAGQLARLDWLRTNLLELSKLDSGLVLLDLRPDDLRACVESAVEQVEPSAERRAVRLDLRLPDGPLRIQHDPQRVGQVVTNLVGNAVKFTPRGGAVSVTVAPDREGARIEVSDTGVGIDATELPHIFDRFYRGGLANDARSEGSGLGLSIVKSIVDMHGGRISVESRVDGGTTFRVVLPRDPRAGPLSAPVSRSETGRGGESFTEPGLAPESR
jgi:signal transduction histidine kinase